MLCVLSHDLNTISGRVAFQPCILGIQDVGPTSGGVGANCKRSSFSTQRITRDFDPNFGIGFRVFQGIVGNPS